eukprot:1535914-Rhodomonas_salina.1
MQMSASLLLDEHPRHWRGWSVRAEGADGGRAYCIPHGEQASGGDHTVRRPAQTGNLNPRTRGSGRRVQSKGARIYLVKLAGLR